MAQHPTNQDTQDFANLTDSLIPSNIYMSSWGQTDGQKIQDIQSFPFNMFTPSFGSMFPLSNNPGNPSTLSDANNHNTAAFNLNSLQQMDSTSSNEQDREVGEPLLPHLKLTWSRLKQSPHLRFNKHKPPPPHVQLYQTPMTDLDLSETHLLL